MSDAADLKARLDERIRVDAALVSAERPVPHVLLIRISRPAKRNALSNGMVIEMGRLLAEARSDASVRCVVITGDEIAFSAGADIKDMQEFGVTTVVNHPRRVDAWNAIQTFPKPMIAAVNGIAFGAGNELALCCDFIVAGSNAQFGQPEAKTGGMAGDGATQRLPRKIGPAYAAYMLMTGEPIDADTAARLGYVVKVCPPAETVAAAVTMAETIASRAPFAIQAMKACIHTAVGATMENGLAMERVWVIRNHGSADRLEGMKAFVEKRAPNFTGTY